MKITATTQLYGIVGDPIRHSRSPRMHNLALEQAGIDGVFLAFQGNTSNIEDVIKAFRVLDVRGGSVTMPVKSAAAGLMDRLSREARLIGAINVFKNEDGQFVGYNTDGMGFVMMLEEHSIPYKGKRVVQAGVGRSRKGSSCSDGFIRRQRIGIVRSGRRKSKTDSRTYLSGYSGMQSISLQSG